VRLPRGQCASANPVFPLLRRFIGGLLSTGVFSRCLSSHHDREEYDPEFFLIKFYGIDHKSRWSFAARNRNGAGIGYRLLIQTGEDLHQSAGVFELAAERIGTIRERARLLCSLEGIVKSSRKRSIVVERSARCGALSAFFELLTLA
jgi:hypothetical protein